MIIGEYTKEELKIVKALEKRLKKIKYRDISIKKDSISSGYIVVAAIEPLAKRVISATITITEARTRIR